MEAGRASRTAEFMALFRALESCRSPAAGRLFEDPLASGFLGLRLGLVALAARLPPLGRLLAAAIDRRWPGARASGVARTRLIDDALRSALARGVDQVVLLGSGFDSRAYRLPGIDAARVFEVDHPSTLRRKRARLLRRLGRLGLELVEDVGSVEYRARYLGGPGSHLRGYEFYRAALAAVPRRRTEASPAQG